MNLANRPPLGQKSPKAKRDFTHMGKVKALPCVGCRRAGPNDAHHCRDMPPFNEQGLYDQLPALGRKSGDRDTIPLCLDCHSMFHNERKRFHDIYGPDYGYIPQTRAAISDMEIDF